MDKKYLEIKFNYFGNNRNTAINKQLSLSLIKMCECVNRLID